MIVFQKNTEICNDTRELVNVRNNWKTIPIFGKDLKLCTKTSLNDETKILTETDTETFFPIPNFPKLKPRLFFPSASFLEPKPSKKWQKSRNQRISNDMSHLGVHAYTYN